MLEIQERGGAVILPVRVQPRASKDEIAGEMAGALKIRLRAPAVRGVQTRRSRSFWRSF
jgi:uncharacterized protein YggU (UPF0235/DUF167 family)